MDKPRNRRALWAFIGVHCGIWLPWRTFTAGHSTPFDFLADAFFHPAKDLACWANRRGIKTLAMAMLAVLEYCWAEPAAPIRGRVLSGSEDQARTLYEYWEKWCWGLLRERIQDEPLRTLTRLDNGDFQIFAASQKRVRGPGVQRLYWDEVDEIDPAIMAASVGTLTSLNGVPARTIAASTWHYAHGPMGQLIDDAEAKGFTLHKWNMWESIQRCPVERHQDGRGCRACPLEGPCRAQAYLIDKNARVGVAARACGLFAIDDAIKQYRQWSLQQWDAEAECKRPALEGLVYPQFDRRVHVQADLDFDDALPTYWAIDWGMNDFVCLWIQENKRRQVFIVDEYWSQQCTTAQNAKAINALDSGVDGTIPIETTFCDPAGRSRSDQTGYSDIQVFLQNGIPCRYTLAPWATDIHNGVSIVRAVLKPAGGPPRLFIAGKCTQLIKAFESYKLRQVNGDWIDEPIKPQACDHPMDALRYYFVNRHAPFRAEVRQMGYSG